MYLCGAPILGVGTAHARQHKGNRYPELRHRTAPRMVFFRNGRSGAQTRGAAVPTSRPHRPSCAAVAYPRGEEIAPATCWRRPTSADGRRRNSRQDGTDCQPATESVPATHVRRPARLPGKEPSSVVLPQGHGWYFIETIGRVCRCAILPSPPHVPITTGR